MATAGPSSPGTVSDNADVGNAWTNPNNAKTSNNSYATVGISSGSINSNTLQLTNFGFSIAGTITNVSVDVEAHSGSAFDDGDGSVKLVVGGSAAGSNKSGAANYAGTDQTHNFSGAPVAYWGLGSLSAAQVNASNFGVAYQAAYQGLTSDTFSLDAVSVTITYTPTGGGADQQVTIRGLLRGVARGVS